MNNFAKITELWKKHLIIATLLSWIIPLILSTLLREPIVYFVNKHLNRKLISIEVVSAFNGSRYDVSNYGSSENIGEFNYKQDDQIISTYWVYKFKIINRGASINENLKFKVDMGKISCKIIDLKNKVVLPLNKNIYISNTIPDLEWSLEEYKRSKNLGVFVWDKPPREIIGFNIYKSRLKNVGYGRVNNELVKEYYYVVEGDPSKQEQVYYYAMEGVQVDGQRSPLTPSIHIIASAAFRPFYKGLYVINANNNYPSSRNNIFNNLMEAIRSNKSGKIFFINKDKSAVSNMAEYIKLSNNNNKIIFLDDIKNLDGKVDINVPSGLDENAEIDFYLLCKVLPGEIPNINIKLEGQPSISLTMNNSAIIKKNKNVLSDNIIREGIPIAESKYNLTPHIVTLYYGHKSIYLAWEFPVNVKWKGVRIFRTDDNGQTNNNYIGKEIYEGPFSKRVFKYKFNSEKWEKEKAKELELRNISPVNEPPQRKRTEIRVNGSDNKLVPFAPLAPSVARIISDEKDEEKHMYYYEDKKVKNGKTYLYTIYIFDENDVYSYPITVSASLNRKSYSPYCYPID